MYIANTNRLWTWHNLLSKNFSELINFKFNTAFQNHAQVMIAVMHGCKLNFQKVMKKMASTTGAQKVCLCTL